ncbi:MAG: ribonuclease III [Acidobacteriaceae bacterium]|nr:ribonuclease III [Acidobacteriaceae bacterium]
MSTRQRKNKRTQGASGLEDQLGYRFRSPALLQLALTHSSYGYEERGDFDHNEPNPPGSDNEQLEFLGDAVLGLVVSELLCEHFPDRNEGELTRIRAALVSRKRMAEFGKALGLSQHLLLGKSAETSGARERPALAANAAEAVLAAMYLDARRHGEDGLLAVRALAETLLIEPELQEIQAAFAAAGPHGALRDAKTVLQERVQAENAGRLRYLDVAQSGPAHARLFTVAVELEAEGHSQRLAEAEGTSKRDAQQSAAKLALENWPQQRKTGRP